MSHVSITKKGLIWHTQKFGTNVDETDRCVFANINFIRLALMKRIFRWDQFSLLALIIFSMAFLYGLFLFDSAKNQFNESIIWLAVDST